VHFFPFPIVAVGRIFGKASTVMNVVSSVRVFWSTCTVFAWITCAWMQMIAFCIGKFSGQYSFQIAIVRETTGNAFIYVSRLYFNAISLT